MESEGGSLSKGLVGARTPPPSPGELLWKEVFGDSAEVWEAESDEQCVIQYAERMRRDNIALPCAEAALRFASAAPRETSRQTRPRPFGGDRVRGAFLRVWEQSTCPGGPRCRWWGWTKWVFPNWTSWMRMRC